MIGYLEGKFKLIEGNLESDKAILVTTGGVGYEIFYGVRPLPPQAVSLFVSAVIKENSHELYCFASYQEKRFFELLLTVKGVGPKMAFTLTSRLGCEGIYNAIVREDKNLFKSVPGVGPKTASQIILDLKDKIKKLILTTNSSSRLANANANANANEGSPKEENEDLSATMNEALMVFRELGWNDEKVWPKMQKILKEQQVESAEQLVQMVLRLS